MKGFSIIVCCYNSAPLLPKTLAALAALNVPEAMRAELILVDNCCTDDTVSVAKKIWASCNSPFTMRVVYEEKPGLSWAREKGIQLAQFDYLLFCDDDNRLSSDYLQVADKLFTAHENIGMLGGFGTPEYENIPSYWPENFYVYGSGPQAKANGKADTLHGAGVLLKKSAFKQLKNAGFFFILSDRKKDQLTSGGDYELCYAISLAGYDTWYHEDLKYTHFISEERMSWSYCQRFIHESAPALDILDVYRYLIVHPGAGIRPFYFQQLRLILYHLKEIMRCSYKRYKYQHKEDLRFLESFYLLFHQKRFISICKNIFLYKDTYKKINGLKERLNPADPDKRDINSLF